MRYPFSLSNRADNSLVKSVTVVEPKAQWNRTHFSLEHIDDLAFYLQLDKQQIDEIQNDIDHVRERQEAKRLSARFDKLQLDRLDEELFEDRMEDILHKHSPLVRAKRRSSGGGHLRTHRSKSLTNTVGTPITHGLARQTMWELCDLSDLQLQQQLGRDRNMVLWKAFIGQSFICAKQILEPTLERREQLREHVRLMRECAHPNLVTHYGVGSDENTKQFFVFAELIEESLVDIINRHKAMPEGVAAIVVYQVLSALVHIHAQGYTHGALKPTKILVNQNGVVKVSDFQDSPEFREPLPRYTAPEILRGNVYLEVSDSWSVGCLLVYLITGKAPYHNMKSYELMSLLKGKTPFRPPQPPKISADCAAFLKLCWEPASERCDATTLINHRFVRHACEDHQSVLSYLRSKAPIVPPLELSFSRGL